MALGFGWSSPELASRRPSSDVWHTLPRDTPMPIHALSSQRSLHNAPIFRLLLKVAVKGTHQCDFFNFCGAFGPQHKADTCLYAAGFLCKDNRDPRLPLSMLLVNFYEIKLLFYFLASGHTASNAPDLFRTPKLSGAGPGQYRGGGPPGKPLGCCWLFPTGNNVFKGVERQTRTSYPRTQEYIQPWIPFGDHPFKLERYRED